MAKLTVTLIDVGWGDSLLIETTDDHDETHFVLIDSKTPRHSPPRTSSSSGISKRQ